MKQLIVLLLLSTIGFSQDCENSILDELLTSDEVNEYFQLALSLNMDDLSFLNNCDDTTQYTLFAPGVDVPTSSITPLIGGTTPLMELILYYIHPDDLYWGPSVPQLPLAYNEIYEMMDGNYVGVMGALSYPEEYYFTINNTINILNPVSPICACNGVIYIIDDLIWAPGTGLEENSSSVSIYPNPAKDVLNVSKIEETGVLEVIDVSGKVLLSQEINKDTQIHTSNYKKGVYLISFTSKNQRFTQLLSIN